MRSSSPTTRRCSTRFHRRKRTKMMRNRLRSKRSSTSMRSRPPRLRRSTRKARRRKPATLAGKIGRRAEGQARGPMRRRCGVRALRPCHVLRIPCTQAAWDWHRRERPIVAWCWRRLAGPAIVCIAQSGSGASAREGPSPEFLTGSASPRRRIRPSFRYLLVSHQLAACPHTSCRLATFCIPYRTLFFK